MIRIEDRYTPFSWRHLFRFLFGRKNRMLIWNGSRLIWYGHPSDTVEIRVCYPDATVEWRMAKDHPTWWLVGIHPKQHPDHPNLSTSSPSRQRME